MECTGEAPENASIIIQCTGTDFFFLTTDPVDYPDKYRYLVGSSHTPVNITRSVSGIPLYEQCTISIVFSNEAGSSEPFILAFGKYSVFMCIILLKLLLTDTTIPLVTTMQPTPTGTSTSLPTASPRTSSSG